MCIRVPHDSRTTYDVLRGQEGQLTGSGNPDRRTLAPPRQSLPRAPNHRRKRQHSRTRHYQRQQWRAMARQQGVLTRCTTPGTAPLSTAATRHTHHPRSCQRRHLCHMSRCCYPLTSRSTHLQRCRASHGRPTPCAGRPGRPTACTRSAGQTPPDAPLRWSPELPPVAAWWQYREDTHTPGEVSAIHRVCCQPPCTSSGTILLGRLSFPNGTCTASRRQRRKNTAHLARTFHE